MTTLTVLGSAGGAPTRTNPASGYFVESGDVAIAVGVYDLASGRVTWLDA